MTTPFGKLPSFSGTSDLHVFTERLDQYFECNNIAGARRRAILLTTLDESVYRTLRDVSHPQLLKDMSFDALMALLRRQYVACTSLFRERYAFYAASQQRNETMSAWLARVKELSRNCKFGADYELVVRDRFVSGLESAAILERLCEDKNHDMSLQRAVEIASAKEAGLRGSVGKRSADVAPIYDLGANKRLCTM